MPATTPPAIVAPALAPVPFQREMKDWIAICDNGRACTLKAIPSFDSRDEPTGLVITVTRKAGPAEQPSVSLWRDDEKPIDSKRLRLDGHPLPPLAWGADDGTLEGADALRLLRLLRDGRGLTLGEEKDADGASLSGAAAAFLAMDAAQGRVGGVTAIARPGPAPASAVPPPPALPVIVAAPQPPPLKNAKALARAVRRAKAADLKEADCDPERADADDAQPLTGTEAVVIVYCRLAAYQGNALAYRAPIANPAGARPLLLPRLPTQPKDEAGDSQFVDPDYDPKTATFGSSAKGRGIGDCGASMSWTFDGRAFRPSGLSEQERCGGEVGDWPDVWRTEVVTKAATPAKAKPRS